MKILAIETSCDETAAAVVEVKSKKYRSYKSYEVLHNLITSELHTSVLSNVVASQINIHKKYGGVFPEIASRAHTEKIIPVVEEAIAKASSEVQSESQTPQEGASATAHVECSSLNDERAKKIDCIAVTTGPGLIGSLLIGVNFAKTLAYAKKLPIIPINHLLGHIYSNWTEVSSEVQSESQTPQKAVHGASVKSSSLNDERAQLPQFPSLILIVSGGHTGLYLMKSHNNIRSLGETLDDAAGEAFDKVAKLLGLGYPGGPAISKAAEKGNPIAYDFPRSMLDRKDFDFSFSGLKTAVLYETKKIKKLTPKIKNDLAASFQQTVIDILVGKTIQAAYEFQPKSICLCGGVSANNELRDQMKKAVSGLPSHPTFHKPQFELSTDNAAMIGLAAAYHLDDATTFDKISANANLKL